MVGGTGSVWNVAVKPCPPKELVEYLQQHIYTLTPSPDASVTAEEAANVDPRDGWKKWVETKIRWIQMPDEDVVSKFLSFVPRKYRAGRIQFSEDKDNKKKTETLFHVAARAAMNRSHDFLVRLVAQMQVLVDFPASVNYSHESSLQSSPLRYALVPKNFQDNHCDDNASSIGEEAFGTPEQILGTF